jgi:hypothetical protein
VGLSATGLFTEQGKAVKKTVVHSDVEEVSNGPYRVHRWRSLSLANTVSCIAGNTTAANAKIAAPEHVFDFAVE